MGAVSEQITEKLRRAFSPLRLDVIDDSARHAGHAGARPEGETHFKVAIVAQAFAGKTALERHRMVNQVLAEELSGPVHALNISARAPDEQD